jgi:Apea-like HEPN
MRTFHRSIFFTKAPLGGQYRYRDYFQISPANLDGIPESQMQRHFPNILEYWVGPEDKITATFGDDDNSLDELLSTAATLVTKQDRILALLSAFTNNLFFVYKDHTGKWAFPVPDGYGEEINQSTSQWCLGLYFFPEMAEQLKIDEFSTTSIQAINLIPYPKYYLYKPHLDSDYKDAIEFPEVMDELLDKYFNLTADKQQIINSSISYAVSAVELNDTKKTLSLLASFTAMETMVNLEYMAVKPEKCGECGQQKFSVARKFREFLLKYLGDTEPNKKKFNKYYSLRSKIVHTGQQLQTEILFAEVDKSARDEELITRVEILQLGKLAIIGWLLSQEINN